MIVIQDLCDDFPMRNGAWRLLPACLAFFSLGFVSSNGQKEREIKKKIPKLFIQSECIFSEEYSEEERVWQKQ